MPITDATRANALDILRRIREHVRRNGVTGGNPTYAADRTVCPRGLTWHFAKDYGEMRRWCTETPALGTTSEVVSKALDRTSFPDDGGRLNYLGGRHAESYWNRLEMQGGTRNEMVAHVDAAIRLVEDPEDPPTRAERVEAIAETREEFGELLDEEWALIRAHLLGMGEEEVESTF